MNMRKQSLAFSFIELLIVMAIVAILSTSVAPLGTQLYRKSQSRAARDTVFSLLQTARLNSVLNKNNTTWGVYLESNTATLFSGPAYSSRTGKVYTVLLPSSSSPTATEVIFSQFTGNTSPQDIQVQTPTSILTYSLNEAGAIDVQ